MLTATDDSLQRLAGGLGLLPLAPPLPGTPLGRFALLRLLGSGTTGSVYGAYDPDLDREVALKVLTGGDARLEARTLARLSHPNVVSLYDVGECDGRSFIAMELVDGEPLLPWLRRRDRIDVIGLFVQLARGLQAVHGAGFVHRDVKPDNVLVDERGRVRLVDFGLVHRVGTSAMVAGTPAYMAPELFDGAPPEARSDQFAFAATLFEALTGERPFAGRSIIELQMHMRAGKPVGGWRALPSSVRAIVRRALDARPSRRFASMAELEAALVRVATRRSSAAIGGAR
jgi:eukaryotic-like serine/threonine-protein kinase